MYAEWLINAMDNVKQQLNQKSCGSVIGCRQQTFEVVEERRTLNKPSSMVDDQRHPLHKHTGQTVNCPPQENDVD